MTIDKVEVTMRVGDKLQVWDEEKVVCLGWGKIILIAIHHFDGEQIPFIQLESGKKLWGTECHYISEKKAIGIGARLFRNIMRGRSNNGK